MKGELAILYVSHLEHLRSRVSLFIQKKEEHAMQNAEYFALDVYGHAIYPTVNTSTTQHSGSLSGDIRECPFTGLGGLWLGAFPILQPVIWDNMGEGISVHKGAGPPYMHRIPSSNT